MQLGQHHDRAPDSPSEEPRPTRRRILLVEDHPIVSRALSDLICHERDLEVCGVAEDYGSALRQIAQVKPDLVLLDITLGGRGGLELLKDIKAQRPQQLILILSMHEETLYAARAIRAGASGYVMKQEATDSVLSAIRRVLEGEIYLSQRMERRMMRRLAHGGATSALDPLEALTDRELEIFRLIGRGKGSREIAGLLCLSVKTIESHRAHIKDKLNLKSASELVQQAVQMETETRSPLPTASAD
jgi:DNA-binding NarL/FixJ family response regulator